MTASEPESLLVGALAAAVEGVEGGDDDQTSTRILDAAYELLCQIGIQRTTMEDVARRARVSRITVYRRFANKGRSSTRWSGGRSADTSTSSSSISSRPRPRPSGSCWAS